MPFELRALEAALAAGVSVLELAVVNLERVAYPALDTLVLRVRPCHPPSLPSRSIGKDLPLANVILLP